MASVMARRVGSIPNVLSLAGQEELNHRLDGPASLRAMMWPAWAITAVVLVPPPSMQR